MSPEHTNLIVRRRWDRAWTYPLSRPWYHRPPIRLCQLLGRLVSGTPPKTGPARSFDRSTRIERPTGTPSDTRGFLISLVSQLLPSMTMNSAHVRAIERRRCRFRRRRLLSSTSPARSGSSSFFIGVFFQTSSRQACPSPQYDFFELSFHQGQVFQTQGIKQEQFRSHVKGGNVEGDGENIEILKSSYI